MLLKKLSIFILLISLSALPSITYANDPNYKKFSSYFYNPVKWLKKYPLNEQTIDDLIMNLGSPDSFIENEDIKQNHSQLIHGLKTKYVILLNISELELPRTKYN